MPLVIFLQVHIILILQLQQLLQQDHITILTATHQDLQTSIHIHPQVHISPIFHQRTITHMLKLAISIPIHLQLVMHMEIFHLALTIHILLQQQLQQAQDHTITHIVTHQDPPISIRILLLALTNLISHLRITTHMPKLVISTLIHHPLLDTIMVISHQVHIIHTQQFQQLQQVQDHITSLIAILQDQLTSTHIHLLVLINLMWHQRITIHMLRQAISTHIHHLLLDIIMVIFHPALTIHTQHQQQLLQAQGHTITIITIHLVQLISILIHHQVLTNHTLHQRTTIHMPKQVTSILILHL
jgi:hypothetical protein